jgi:hypothetical protein
MARELFGCNPDGANYQARAVLAYLESRDGLENSWSELLKEYVAHPKVSRWENCREQGYVVWLYSPKLNKQINIAFFEHRNSDAICAVEWYQTTLNAPTIETAQFGDDAYKDKYDTSFDVGYGEAGKMADWIYSRLEEFWAGVLEKEEAA